MLCRLSRFTFILCALMLLSGCFLQGYRPNTQQGNILNAHKIARIHTGMSAASVKRLLGNPVMTNLYSNGKITYVYTFQRGHQKVHIQRFIVHLQRGIVTSTHITKN